MPGNIKLSEYGIFVLLALFGLALTGVVIFRLVGPLVFDPVMVEGLAPDSRETVNNLNLNDERVVEQTFEAAAANASYIGIRAANLRGANNTAVLTVEILGEEGVIQSAYSTLGSLRSDDVTKLPFQIRLEAGNTYTIRLRTDGVPPGSDLSVLYESDSRGFQNGRATLTVGSDQNSEQRQLTGNIRFQILRVPTKWLITDTLLRSPAGWLLAGYFMVLVFGFLRRRQIQSKLGRFVPPLDIPEGYWHIRELIFVSILGIVLAFTAIAPYFTQMERITTAGDVQRALVYRAVARTALIEHGEVGLWDPYLCGGEPLLANMESAQFDPFFLLVMAFGENTGVRLSVLATLVIGFIGTYMLARRYTGLPKIPALLAAGIFPFSGFQMLAFANGNFAWIPVGWIPWVLYFYLASLKRWSALPAASLFLAFIFLGGSLHMTLYALIAAGLIGFFLSIFYRSFRPVLALVLCIMLFVPLAAVKLLPAAEIQAVSGEFDRPPPFIQPWSALPRMFWDRSQLTTPQWRYDVTGENFRWIEYGAYIGVVPVLLGLAGIVFSRGKKLVVALAGAGLVLLLMTFGEFPWTVMGNMPFLYGPLRNPQRARVVFLLLFGILAGYGLTAVARRLIRTDRVRVFSMAAVAALILVDLATFHASLYPGLFSLERPYIKPVQSFERRHESYTDFEENGYYKVSYENYRAGQGVEDICMPYMMQRGVHARGIGGSNPQKEYFGEALLTEGGEVTNVEVRENTVHVVLQPAAEGYLVLNQNYFPGWRAEPPREIRNWKGLTAARVTPEDHEVLFRYRPQSYVVGFWVSVLAVLGSAAVLYMNHRRV